MNLCESAGCNGIQTSIYTTNGWISVCPICGNKKELPLEYKSPSEADIEGGYGYIKAINMDYAEAEERFLRAAHGTENTDLKLGYLIWAVKCCFGIEYVKEMLYKNDPSMRTYHYMPVFARFPYNHQIAHGCIAIEELEQYLMKHPHEGVLSLLNEARSLYSETGKVIAQSNNKYDIFLAWHDREGSNQCHDFARDLNNWIRNNNRGIYSFVSFVALSNKQISHFEPYIYAAISSARCFVIIVDDYDSLNEGFLRWEIKRMMNRLKSDSKITILFNGMKNHIGQITEELMSGWQRHYEDSELTPDRIELLGRDIRDALSGISDQKEKSAEISAPVIPLINAVSEDIPAIRGTNSRKNNTAIVPPCITKKDFEKTVKPQSHLKELKNLYTQEMDRFPLCLLVEKVLLRRQSNSFNYDILNTFGTVSFILSFFCILFGLIGLPYYVFSFPKLWFAFLLIVSIVGCYYGSEHDLSTYRKNSFSIQMMVLSAIHLFILSISMFSMKSGIQETIKTFCTANFLIFGTATILIHLFVFLVNQSYRSFISRLKKSIKHSSSELVYSVGCLYFNETKIRDSYNSVLDPTYWFSLAAEKGNSHAMYALAGMYANGINGLQQDDKKVVEFLHMLSKNGYIISTHLEYCKANWENSNFWEEESELLKEVCNICSTDNSNQFACEIVLLHDMYTTQQYAKYVKDTDYWI